MTLIRTYQETHPWISFAPIDLKNAPARLWIRLGEAASKCEHIAGVPLSPTTADKLHRLYLAKGALATTAIEGNTLTEQEAIQALDGSLQLPKSKEYLAVEINNIKDACNLIGNQIMTQNVDLTPSRIRELNVMVLRGLTLDEGVVPGEIRKGRGEVVVGNIYRGAPAEDCEYLVERLCRWLSEIETMAELGPTPTAIIKAVMAHLYLAWIHPFGDGNGRTARLIEFQLLLFAGVPTPASHLLSNHYNHTRAEYYRQLDRASKTGGEVIPFLQYAVDGLVDGLREQLETIRNEQWTVAWRDYVYSRFRDKTEPRHIRQRHVVLDLTQAEAPVPVLDIPRLTPRLAEAYTKLHPRTLDRDIKELLELRLVELTPEGLRARQETIRAFLPKRRESVT